MNTETAIKEALGIDGAIGAALVDYESGMCLHSGGGGQGFDIEVAAAANTEVVRSKVRALGMIGLDDRVEDILITLGEQYHVIRLVEQTGGSLFLYLALDRQRGNLALARHKLRQIDVELEI